MDAESTLRDNSNGSQHNASAHIQITDEHGTGNAAVLDAEVDDECKRARGRLLWLLEARAYTAKRLREKLQEKRFSDNAIEYALTYVQEIGYQSDAQFAVDFAESKWRRSRWAGRRIGAALRQKGVGDADITAALLWLAQDGVQADADARKLALGDSLPGRADKELAEEEEGSGGTTEGRIVTALVEEAEKRLARLQRYPVATQKRRVVSWLQRGGHSWGTCREVLERVGLYGVY